MTVIGNAAQTINKKLRNTFLGTTPGTVAIFIIQRNAPSLAVGR